MRRALPVSRGRSDLTSGLADHAEFRRLRSTWKLTSISKGVYVVPRGPIGRPGNNGEVRLKLAASGRARRMQNWKAHFIRQENMYDPPLKLPLPKLINLLTDLKEERDVCAKNSWVLQPMVKIIDELEASFKKHPPIKVGTPDPYRPPKE